MKILCHVHAYPPSHMSGAETMIHDLNKYLVSVGHEVKVMYAKVDRKYEGVSIVSNANKIMHFDWADVIITHLDRSNDSINIAKARGKKVIHLIHNTHINKCVERRNNFAVYNSEWVKKELNYACKHDFILYPCVNYRDYSDHINHFDQKYIALINCNDNKGGKQLIDLARAMPDKRFLGVKGSYGAQIVKRGIDNLEYVDNQKDIRKIYDKCKIIIMPSEYESWGRVATEAMSAGIPVIANPTAGLKENISNAGIWANRGNINEWINAIRLLEDRSFYESISIACKQRAKDLDPIKNLSLFNQFIERINKLRYEA